MVAGIYNGGARRRPRLPEQFSSRPHWSLVAGAEPRTGVVVGVDRSRGDAVRLAGHGDVTVAGDGDALARVDRVLVHGL